ncbi:hypothetical protein [Kitasatospora azatica]|uniref:hypothetical protein n=1 Tax=Kitasatospora azatica TaxID=58347 RepID=UPI0012FAE271|nr:hypothetical protein [Kitasatospora azatica]
MPLVIVQPGTVMPSRPLGEQIATDSASGSTSRLPLVVEPADGTVHCWLAWLLPQVHRSIRVPSVELPP